jgi:hypothetical protein
MRNRTQDDEIRNPNTQDSAGRGRERAGETDAEVRLRHQQLSDTARERHDALTKSIDRLESALAAAAPHRERAWRERASRELDGVRDEIRAHAESVDQVDGLLDQIRLESPRLSTRIDAVQREHVWLTERAESLAGRLGDATESNFNGLRREAAELLAALRAHRATEADLIYEAFWTDIGAVD